MNLAILQSIIRDIREDCAMMRKVNPDGRVNGFAARFEGYAAALEGHVPPNPLPQLAPPSTTLAQVLQAIEKDKIENDEDDVPTQP